jgi:mitogen-activated protein kinase 1/3
MTKHVVTRWYRAPELPLYNDGEYSPAIDVWSTGCCFAEMLGMLPTGNAQDRLDRRALFPGGSCYPMSRNRDGQRHLKGAARDQLNVIFDVLGTPDEASVAKCRTEQAKEYIRSLPAKPGIDLSKRYPVAPEDSLDFLRRMLAFHPKDRITIDEALAHPFLASVRRPDDEIEAKHWVPFGKIEKPTVRSMIVDEIRHYNKYTVGKGWVPQHGDSYDPESHSFARELESGVAGGTPPTTPGMGGSSAGPVTVSQGDIHHEGKK